jgi:hypothetical protein
MPAKTSAAASFPAANFEKLLSNYETGVERAVASGSRMLEQATAFAKGNVEAAFASTRIAVSGLDALTKQNGYDPVAQWSSWSAAWTRMPSAKTPADFFATQTQQVGSYCQEAMAHASRLGEAMFDLGCDVADPIAKRCTAALTDLPASWLDQ